LWAVHERVYHGRKFDNVDQVKQAMVLNDLVIPLNAYFKQRLQIGRKNKNILDCS